MAKELMNVSEQMTKHEEQFVSDLQSIAGEARRQAYRAADHVMVVRN